LTRGPLFEKLFEPITIGKITVKNRIVMPPMDTDFGTRDGRVTKRHINYFVERAKGWRHRSYIHVQLLLPLHLR